MIKLMLTFTVTDHDFRERLFHIAASPPDDICPFCGCIYEDGDYEDYGGYSQKVSPATCPECHAYELGGWKLDPKTQVYHAGWVREKQPGDEAKYPLPPDSLVPRVVETADDFFAGLLND